MRSKTLAVAVFLIAGSAVVSAQTFNPPPVKHSGARAGSHTVGVDLGWGATSSVDLDFGGGTELEFDYDSLPTLNVTYMYGAMDKLGVGAQFYWTSFDFDDDVLENSIDDDDTWTLDAFALHTVFSNKLVGIGAFAGLGITDESDLHYRLGAIVDFAVSPGWKVAPYAMWSAGIYDDGDTESEIGTLRFGANVIYDVQLGLSIVADVAWELQDVTVDISGADADDSGNGFAFAIGVQYTLK